VLVIVETFAGNVQNFVENSPEIVENPFSLFKNLCKTCSLGGYLAMVSTMCTGFQQSFQHFIVETFAI
jgi:hypothetical protein